MAITTFVLVLLATIVLSNILDSAFPSFPLPLIQIGLGVIIALTPLDIRLELEPEIFMGVLIAPLLYREAEEADLAALWRVRREVIFMVFGLVFVTVFVIGFSVNYFAVTIPLAACFCLGGILGPTDPIAVKSVSGRIHIDKQVMSILKGESLINDATGVIAFNFAALALVTGQFSVGQAALKFVVFCAGGLAVGLLVSFVKNLIMRSLKRARIHNAAAFVIIDMLVPFLCFFIAEAAGASGIIAAVTAGTRQALLMRHVDIFEARFSVIKNSFWDMISLVFNSFIFILLGLELPVIVPDLHEKAGFSVGFAMSIGLLATGVMFAVRFVGVTVAARGLPGETKMERVRNRIVLTLSGVKGTVSLATAFALPLFIAGGQVFRERNMLLFITACAIIYSLVIAIVVLPLIAKPRVREVKKYGFITVLQDTIERLEEDDGFSEAVVLRLKRRLDELEAGGGKGSDGKGSDGKGSDGKGGGGQAGGKPEAGGGKGSGGKGSGGKGSDGKEGGGQAGGKPEAGRGKGGRKKKADERNAHEAERQLIIQKAMVGELTEEEFAAYNRQLKECFVIEREVLAGYVRDGLISEEESDEIRVEINTLENFTIEEIQDNIAARLLIRGRNRRRRGRGSSAQGKKK